MAEEERADPSWLAIATPEEQSIRRLGEGGDSRRVAKPLSWLALSRAQDAK
jgi:hypothetical protein